MTKFRQVAKNWTDRQLYDYLLGCDSFWDFFDGHMGLLLNDEVKAFHTAEDMFDVIRAEIFERNLMDDPNADMHPFQGRDTLAPGETYYIYDVYESSLLWVVKVKPVQPYNIFRFGNCGVDEYFRDGNLVGIGDGWCILLEDEKEAFEND